MAHGDFYFAINATFYHFTENWGEQALIDYWRAMGSQYLKPLAERWQAEGPASIARYWSEYFAGEPGAQVTVSQPDAGSVLIDVSTCPAIRWLKESKDAATHPPVHPLFCQHCLHINQSMIESFGYTFELSGGGGSCQQRYIRKPALGQESVP
jgi:hypothetical protein